MNRTEKFHMLFVGINLSTTITRSSQLNLFPRVYCHKHMKIPSEAKGFYFLCIHGVLLS